MGALRMAWRLEKPLGARAKAMISTWKLERPSVRTARGFAWTREPVVDPVLKLDLQARAQHLCLRASAEAHQCYLKRIMCEFLPSSRRAHRSTASRVRNSQANATTEKRPYRHRDAEQMY